MLVCLQWQAWANHSVGVIRRQLGSRNAGAIKVTLGRKSGVLDFHSPYFAGTLVVQFQWA